jgi:CO/xanthine dehydrogenase Mo-binding subunit
MMASLQAGMVARALPGPYTIPNYRAKHYTVATNKTPLGPYRGVGRPGACFAIERLVDEIARAVGREPNEVRRLTRSGGKFRLPKGRSSWRDRAAIALWGRDNAAWAQELGIAERTIRRYENGDMGAARGGLAGIARRTTMH